MTQRENRERILSGTGSKRLWRDINKVRNYSEPTHMAIYHLACKCQELETIIRNLQERVGQLESERR